MSEIKNLTKEQRVLLDSMKTFRTLDKGSQDRLRAKIDKERKSSKAFEEAFGMSLGTALQGSKETPKGGKLAILKDVITHPINAMKGEVGRAIVKARNKETEILKHPHPILQKIAEPVDLDKISQDELSKIARQMGGALRSVKHGDRLGIAAPQIGISKRIFVCLGAFCINPKFTPPKVGDMVDMIEGCYSLEEGKTYSTKRHKYGWVEFHSIGGELRKFIIKGTEAIVFQHELDHLDGKCCCDIGEEIIKE